MARGDTVAPDAVNSRLPCWQRPMLSAAKSSTDFRSLEAQGSLAVKLMSLFERQFATLTKVRKPPQVVTVEHVHRHLHVNAPGPTGGEIRIEGQAQATDPRTL